MKSIFSSLAVLAVSLSTISAQIAIGGECGGPRYQGSNLCEDGAYCALVTDDYQCLKLEDIYAKESISFILTTLPTFTFGTVKPTKTIGTLTFTTPCPTVTVTSTTTLPGTTVTSTTSLLGTITTTLVKTITATQSCSSTIQTTSTIPTTSTISTTTTTTTKPSSTSTISTTTTTTTTTKLSSTSTQTTTASTTTTTLPCPSLQPEYPAGKNFTYKGVNIAGFEFGCDQTGTCTPPNLPPLSNVGKTDGCGQMKWFYSHGMNTFRLPIGWQYATPTLGGSFDPTMWSNYYSSLVKCCLALPGAYCVIDIHNWARWNNDIIGQTISDTPYIRLWQMIASQYASEPRVIFGLMNEPYKLNLSAWAATLQRVVTAIRAIAPRHVILLPGIEFAHADTFLSSGTATTLDAIVNPDGSKDNLLFDLHQWLDRGNLGTSSVCVTDNISVFGPVVNWLRCHKRKAFLSATGGGNAASDSCMAGSTFMCKQMSYLFSNSDVIVGYTGWAAGSYDTSYIYDETPAWPSNIPYADTPLVATCMYWP